jgi:RimJ/RimL family protein N-acetyltransferase
MREVSEEDLHKNSVISELSFDEKSSTASMLPESISVDSLNLIPIFKADFRDVCRLYRYSSEEVFRHYGSTKHKLPDETRDYVKSKEKAWKNAEWFEYVIEYEDELIGKTYLNAGSNLDSFEIGYWLQKEYWGNEISQKLADALIHISFEYLDASYFYVGCVIQNQKSRRAIEKYINRYSGSFYGFVPRTESVYHPNVKDPKKVVKHPEWVITNKDYKSNEKGISTTIPGLDYEDIEFNESEYI